MVANGPHPHPHPWRKQKSPARGQNKIAKTHFDDYLFFVMKKIKIPLPGGLKRGLQVKITKTIAVVCPRGSKKRKSNNDNKHCHGQEKGDPQHYVEKQPWTPSVEVFMAALPNAIGNVVTSENSFCSPECIAVSIGWLCLGRFAILVTSKGCVAQIENTDLQHNKSNNEP